VEELLKQLLAGQAQIIKRLDTIENTMVTKDMFHQSVAENQKDIIAMLERTATKDSIADLKAGVLVINNRLFDQETKIQKLEIAK
jgi:hypothetical protein